MTVIDVQGLTKRYGRFTAVDGISFQVSRGEIFGFLGPNGVGKTSTIRILTGLSRASEGKCQVLGQEMTPDNRELRRRIGVVFEEPNLYARLSGRQNLEFYAALLWGASLQGPGASGRVSAAAGRLQTGG